MKTSEAASLVVLSHIIINHNQALKRVGADKDKVAKVNQQTIEAIMDNAHNITHRASPSTPGRTGE